jgi:hypothetical protein
MPKHKIIKPEVLAPDEILHGLKKSAVVRPAVPFAPGGKRRAPPGWPHAASSENVSAEAQQAFDYWRNNLDIWRLGIAERVDTLEREVASQGDIAAKVEAAALAMVSRWKNSWAQGTANQLMVEELAQKGFLKAFELGFGKCWETFGGELEAVREELSMERAERRAAQAGLTALRAKIDQYLEELRNHEKEKSAEDQEHKEKKPEVAE